MILQVEMILECAIAKRWMDVTKKKFGKIIFWFAVVIQIIYSHFRIEYHHRVSNQQKDFWPLLTRDTKKRYL